MIDVCFDYCVHGQVLLFLGLCKDEDIDLLKNKHPEIDAGWLKKLFVGGTSKRLFMEWLCMRQNIDAHR